VGEDVGMLTGVVQSVIFKGVHYEMLIRGDIPLENGEGYLWKAHSTTMQPVGTKVGMTIVPYNIHIMHKMPKEAQA
jgi:spermidine/putrescine transport system ATP-binding protein